MLVLHETLHGKPQQEAKESICRQTSISGYLVRFFPEAFFHKPRFC